MNGELIIRVYSDTIAQPVEDAEIIIKGEGVNRTITTDEDGQTAIISLPAPDPEVDFIPGYKNPYTPYNVYVTKKGLRPAEVIGVDIFPGGLAYQDVFLSSYDENGIPETTTIPPWYIGSYPPKIPEQGQSVSPFGFPEINESVTPHVLPSVVIPEYITVHDGYYTTSGAPDYQTSYFDYICNVANCEIYADWPPETIKANVLAIQSFTLNRIYTEYYRTRGYNFTITSSTAIDHKWIKNKKLDDRIVRVVGEVNNQYLVYDDENFPFLSQYTDGITVPQRPYQMTQWGSYDLGVRGYTALEILRYFYKRGNITVSIKTAPVVSETPQSWPGYSMTIGSCGKDVQTIQNQLNVIRNNYPGITKITNPNGEFDSTTASAVKVMQKVAGLPQTGVVDRATWYSIQHYYAAVTNIANGIGERSL